ncbi:MAG: hypothetical protein K2P58_11035 [Hyphomonadaceae bacterium]|nr:hypothetical protein [Hyphomonadaceae bacterium]
MTAVPLIEIGWKSILVAAMLVCLLHVLRLRSASQRSAIAHAGLIALLIIPLTVLAGPRLEVGLRHPIGQRLRRAADLRRNRLDRGVVQFDPSLELLHRSQPEPLQMFSSGLSSALEQRPQHP